MSSSISPTDLPAAWLIALKQVNCVINKHLAEQLHQSLPQCLQVPNLHAATSAVTSQHPCSCRVTVTTAFRWLCKRSSHGRHWFHFIHFINTLCTVHTNTGLYTHDHSSTISPLALLPLLLSMYTVFISSSCAACSPRQLMHGLLWVWL